MRALNNIYQGVQRRGFARITKLTNIKRIIGYDEQDNLIDRTNVDLYLMRGRINKIVDQGDTSKEVTELKVNKVVDAQGALVTPGFIDPHTHIFPPEDRAEEFCQRVTKSYQEIAAAGGGILSSVNACRNATFEQVFEVNERNIKRFIAQGTTTLEMKSGYGLNLDTEIMLLKVINELKKKYKSQIEIIPTFLGAHDIPPEYKGKTNDYVNLIIDKMLPEIKKQDLAYYCDVFCENGYFDDKQTTKIIQAAKKLKFRVRIHADEFEDSKGAETAARLRVHSADHLMAISDHGIDRLSFKKTVATMLPGTSVFLGKKNFAPVRKMIEREIRVAIATDYNPGSCLFNSQPLMMNFAMMYGELTLEEAFKGVTRNAAFSLGRRNVGIINEGAYADLIFWKLNGINQIPYYNTESAQFITHIIKRGKVFSKLPKVKAPKQPKKEKEETKQ